MRQLIIYVAFAVLFVFMGCKKSVLSEMVITDPSVVSVAVKIYQNKEAEKEVAVILRDSNANTIDLLDGSVWINDSRSVFQYSKINPLLERGYVITPSADDNSFSVLIKLNESDSYSFTVDAKTDFPGFFRNTPLTGSELLFADKYVYKYADFYIANNDFKDKRVHIVYRILKQDIIQ
ncbi:MAG: hypothetical protein JXA53_01720 [Bacteroidales bacterium]|nr:hypothetical protein [Bacteroidales bacterium]